jgi:multimeric flavodoxin WrbA
MAVVESRLRDMKVLAVCGSPRRGNTESMLRKLLEEVAGAGGDTELALLRELSIGGCDGCLACEVGGKNRKGVCRIQDDMYQLCPKLIEADCLVFGTPVYFEMLSGQLKTFMDRTCPIWPGLDGKLIAGVAVAEEGVGKAVQNLRTYADVCGMRWVGSVTALAKTPRQASKKSETERRLRMLAMKIIGAARA